MEEWGELMLSQGARYNVRHTKIPFNIDVSDFGTDGKTFSVDFQLGQFHLPSGKCEVYLDQFLTYNSLTSDQSENMAFCLHIEGLNIRSHTASETNGASIQDRTIIPNEHKSVANNHSLVIHKGKKLNYICDIENLHSIPDPISGTITNLEGNPIFHSNLSGTSGGATGIRQFTYALTGIDASNFTTTAGFPIQSGAPFTFTPAGPLSASGAINGTFLAAHFDNTTTLHFSSDKAITLDRTTAGNNTLTVTGVGDILLDHTPETNNPNLMLIGPSARFIAEFVIIQK